MPPSVDIVAVGDVPEVQLEAARDGVAEAFGVETKRGGTIPVPPDAYDGERDQYDAERLVEALENDGRYRLGVTTADLYFERRNYVFGVAYLDGTRAVISTDRLVAGTDGVGDVHDRIRKVAVKETGHLFGLENCDEKRCAMRFAPTVREIDVRSAEFCRTHARELEEEAGVDAATVTGPPDDEEAPVDETTVADEPSADTDEANDPGGGTATAAGGSSRKISGYSTPPSPEDVAAERERDDAEASGGDVAGHLGDVVRGLAIQLGVGVFLVGAVLTLFLYVELHDALLGGEPGGAVFYLGLGIAAVGGYVVFRWVRSMYVVAKRFVAG